MKIRVSGTVAVIGLATLFLLAPSDTLIGQARLTLAELDQRLRTLEDQPTAKQIATKRWFTVRTGLILEGGVRPAGIAFDGSDMWIANRGDGPDSPPTVTTLRAHDGTVRGVFGTLLPPPTQHSTYGVVYDGQLVWAGIDGVGQAWGFWETSAGLRLHLSAGTDVKGLAFDGTYIWAARGSANTVDRFRARDGGGLQTFAYGSVNPFDVVFDGVHIWVISRNSSNNVTKVRASDGVPLGHITVGQFPMHGAFDGSHVWVSNNASNTVTKIRAADSQVVGTYSVGVSPRGLVFDGRHIWVANEGSNTVSKLRASDGATLHTATVPGSPLGLAFDGSDIWVTLSPRGVVKL